MEKFKLQGKHKVMVGSKTYELMESKDPEDHKKAKKLTEFCFAAAKCGYDYQEMVALREKYKDVV